MSGPGLQVAGYDEMHLCVFTSPWVHRPSSTFSPSRSQVDACSHLVGLSGHFTYSPVFHSPQHLHTVPGPRPHLHLRLHLWSSVSPSSSELCLAWSFPSLPTCMQINAHILTSLSQNGPVWSWTSLILMESGRWFVIS